ncbi:PAS domain S-box protein [Niabella sp. CJ426]|uniref:PAS domain-containing sensor histidine kinase n=1 Tax=Niabella sp. CJ426 TaxID=3393740 RepID=UPI003CFD498D
MNHNKDYYVPSSLIETINEPCIIADLDHIIITWNHGAEKLFEYNTSEITGKHLSALLSPDSFNSLVDKANQVARMMTERFDCIIVTKSGRHLTINILLSNVIDHRGALAGNSLMFPEVKERYKIGAMPAESNELMRLTFDPATDFAIITFDASAKIMTWSKGAELIFGYSETEAIEHHTSLIFTSEDVANGIDELELQTAGVKGRAEDERWHVGKYGTRFFMSGVMVSIVDNGGAIIGYAKVTRDITKRKVLEEQKDEFIKIASHELKTPVTTVKAFIEILLERFEKSEDQLTAGMLQTIDTQVSRLVELIRTLLDTTTFTSGDMPMRMESTDISTIIREQIAAFEKISPNHRLVYNPQKLRPVILDKRLIEQVFVNLISNASNILLPAVMFS